MKIAAISPGPVLGTCDPTVGVEVDEELPALLLVFWLELFPEDVWLELEAFWLLPVLVARLLSFK